MEMTAEIGEVGGGQLAVPPGFRFHPTEEELLYYYLKKKVSYEPIDLEVIKEIDLNKLEPWELIDKCRIGSGEQQEWYFFSHKDKKYPTSSRTNRATAAGFWKATGRDKAIRLNNSKLIGRRKTLVFYTGRAPRGQKTDWIMYEYRLDEDDEKDIQEEGWVVCRVFKKKSSIIRNFHQERHDQEEDHHHHQQHDHHINTNSDFFTPTHHSPYTSMHLPRLFSPESTLPFLQFSQRNLPSQGADWSFLDRLLLSQQHQTQQQSVLDDLGGLTSASSPSSGYSFRCLWNETEVSKFPK